MLGSPPRSTGPLVLYELNEVSWRVVDWYTSQRPESNLASVVGRGETFTSITLDQGELHPWVTWPTLHRSVYNSTHGISYINQDLSCARAYAPIWTKVAAAGKKVGVFGSLQSYPPPSGVPFAFYVPDTFAPGPETIPPRYACFQRLNLRQTQADRAIAKPVEVDGSLLADLVALLRNGLTRKTVRRLAVQLLSERKAPIHRTRRPILQAPVAFDVFRHALIHTEPDFCTFFTNHVAGIMHRYWKYAFPEDFQYRLQGDSDHFHRESLLVALDYADEQIGFLKSYVDDRNGLLYIASSMGQEAIHQEAEVEVCIENLERFTAAIGLRKPFKSLMAMHPQYSFEFDSGADMVEFSRLVQGLRRADGKPAFHSMEHAGKTASWSAASGSGFLPADGGPLYLTNADSNVRLPFETIGLKMIQRDVGTGYHQPRGIVIRYGAGVRFNGDRRSIESVQIAPMMMDDLGIEVAPQVTVPSTAPATEERTTVLSD